MQLAAARRHRVLARVGGSDSSGSGCHQRASEPLSGVAVAGPIIASALSLVAEGVGVASIPGETSVDGRP